jgi:hypothetical protein
MNTKFYDFGNKSVFVPEEADRNMTDRSLAVAKAKEKELGFIVEHEDFGDRIVSTILAWNVKVLSYNEVYKRLAHIPRVNETLKMSSKHDAFIYDVRGRFVVPFKVNCFRLI